MNKPSKWDLRFIEAAKFFSTWSEDESTKIGCLAVDCDNNVRSIGFNGLPRGIKNIPKRNQRPEKYSYYEHGERNLIFNAARIGVSLKGCRIYLTWFPCADCSRALIQCGITEIICQKPLQDSKRGLEWDKMWNEKLVIAQEMLKEAGVKVKYYE